MLFAFRIVLALALSVSGFAQDLAAKLDQVASGFQKDHSFIGAVLVAKGGKVVLEKGYGMASIELEVPNGPDTKFRLGSITKQFTATAIQGEAARIPAGREMEVRQLGLHLSGRYH